MADVRVGIGGWTYEPWRGTFYPDDLTQKRELEYASRAMTAIEVNGTYYSSFKPKTFETWAQTAPDGFVYTLKASRYCTNRKKLAEGGDSIAKFLGQGIVELGDKLGPILWQFMATKKFEPEDFAAFLDLLPEKQNGVKLRHAVQVRHGSFHVPEFVALLRERNVAAVYADSNDYPALADLTGDFVYARIENAREEEAEGFSSDELDRWADVARGWARGESPEGLPYVAEKSAAKVPRETFVFMINGAKVRAPVAAQALLARLRD
ncbi:DUF72 domain-containing protein [Stakelama tenebrarum]|uniref:DUF72 domain-containing protein n=1 Tax=Stakelama tenebrarum TaxID=2711215 RepID=A0A6G6Y1B9_9SPHN|nr:DUF72 domain-containing protein [Sphingosinithalassobacter tenebrarum]QIG78631.1 DUF72 domain-containing protein [Sphingosinithalassobacter tenebrarum]